MNQQLAKYLAGLVLCAGALSAAAQNYSIDWYKVAGGGGASSGGAFSLTGTIGQPDAGGPLTGGNYSLTGGFWSLVGTVPSTNSSVPNLTIRYASPNTVVVSWPNTGSFSLQQKASVNSGTWAPSAAPVTTVNGTNSISISPPAGTLFFRLAE
jgi:hypothetical protein